MISAQTSRKLAPEIRKVFHEYTPPILYLVSAWLDRSEGFGRLPRPDSPGGETRRYGRVVASHSGTILRPRRDG
ncbi:MAG: hypothetical protein ACOC2V_03510 [Alkalispirochaeta sp.]